MKFSMIMPTYNDSETIIETLESIRMQTYSNWELIIVNDGSTDNTEEIIKSYIEKYKLQENIKYIYQENQDQLNAVLNATNYITGDYVYIIHSDDLFADNTVLQNCTKILQNRDIDILISDLIIIDENSKEVDKQKILRPNKKLLIPILTVNYGRNILCDTGIIKKEYFLSKVTEQYLTWNMSFWFYKENNNFNIANVQISDIPVLRYRIHSTNYNTTELGKYNILSGELRTLMNLLSHYTIPLHKLQYYIFRLFCKLNIINLYIPVFFKKETKNKYKDVKRLVDITVGSGYEKNEYIDSFLEFIKNYKNRTIEINEKIEDEDIYYGKDMRSFNKKIINNEISQLYKKIFEEMRTGFNEIAVNKEQMDKLNIILKFLNIDSMIKIKEV